MHEVHCINSLVRGRPAVARNRIHPAGPSSVSDPSLRLYIYGIYATVFFMSRAPARSNKIRDESLLVRIDRRSKALLRKAAAATGLSISDYVRSRVVPLARQDVVEADTGVLKLSRDDQIALWRALQSPPNPTAAQRSLGKLIRSVR